MTWMFSFDCHHRTDVKVASVPSSKKVFPTISGHTEKMKIISESDMKLRWWMGEIPSPTPPPSLSHPPVLLDFGVFVSQGLAHLCWKSGSRELVSFGVSLRVRMDIKE